MITAAPALAAPQRLPLWLLGGVAVAIGVGAVLHVESIWLYLLTLLCIGAGVVCLVSPLYGLLIFILLSGVQNVYFQVLIPNTYEMRWYPMVLPVILSFVAVISRRAARLQRHSSATPLDGLLFMIVAYELITVIWAPVFLYAAYLSGMLLTNLMMYYLFTSVVQDEATLKKVINFWIFCGFLSACSVILNLWFDTDTTYYLSRDQVYGVRVGFTTLFERPGGWSGPAHLVGFAATGIAMAFGWLLLYPSRGLRFLFTVLILFSVAAIVLSETRGVLISLFAGIIFHLYIFPRLRRRVLGYSLLGMAVMTATLFAVQPKFINRILIGFGYTGELFFTENATGYAEGDSGSVTGSEPEGQSGMRIRIWWWVNGLKAMVERPLTFLFGLGQGGFGYYSDGSPEVNGVIWAFFYDMGLIGCIFLAMFLYILLSNIKNCLQKGKQTLSYYMFLAVLVGFMMDVGLHGLIDFDLNCYGSKNFWMPFGLLMASINIVKRETADASHLPYDSQLIPGQESVRRKVAGDVVAGDAACHQRRQLGA